jgi:hypothetical protein
MDSVYGIQNRNSIRRTMGILSRTERVFSNKLFRPTVSYVKVVLSSGGRDIASLSYFGSDEIGPVMSLFAIDGITRGIHCPRVLEYAREF